MAYYAGCLQEQHFSYRQQRNPVTPQDLCPTMGRWLIFHPGSSAFAVIFSRIQNLSREHAKNSFYSSFLQRRRKIDQFEQR
jgi:hypothetical protein